MLLGSGIRPWISGRPVRPSGARVVQGPNPIHALHRHPSYLHLYLLSHLLNSVISLCNLLNKRVRALLGSRHQGRVHRQNGQAPLCSPQWPVPCWTEGLGPPLVFPVTDSLCLLLVGGSLLGQHPPCLPLSLLPPPPPLRLAGTL